eukprot:gene12014-14120_t
MPMVRLRGDPAVMGRIKTDSKNDEHWWTVDINKPLSEQARAVEELKKILNAYTEGTGIGLDGVC